MKDGYIRVASASIDTLIGNVKHNANEIKKVLKETREKKAQVVVFPELVFKWLYFRRFIFTKSSFK